MSGQSAWHDQMDEAAQAAIMVCQTCGEPTPPEGYTYLSNAAGENLGGIFCSNGCAEIARLSGWGQ